MTVRLRLRTDQDLGSQQTTPPHKGEDHLSMCPLSIHPPLCIRIAIATHACSCCFHYHIHTVDGKPTRDATDRPKPRPRPEPCSDTACRHSASTNAIVSLYHKTLQYFNLHEPLATTLSANPRTDYSSSALQSIPRLRVRTCSAAMRKYTFVTVVKFSS